MAGGYEIGVYYFPNYHQDSRNEQVHGKEWTEWELMKNARPRFPGHQQPKVPLWGYEDEADPKVFARKISAAADYGITNFIFDWYWYDNGPFLAHGLEEGFLPAENNHRIRFSLMWANHDWIDIHPAGLPRPFKLLYPGSIKKEIFEVITDYVVEKYFKHPSYYKIDGCPYFSIYELFRLVQNLGGIKETLAALQRFREKTRSAGFPDLHLNAVIWGLQILPGEQSIKNPNELLAALDFNSLTSYVWVHHHNLPTFPATDYDLIAADAEKFWYQAERDFIRPYFPNVSMGWDPSPRTRQSDPYENTGYPFMATFQNNTPAAFQKSLERVKTFLDRQNNGKKIFTINAWNEWTEGSYLEPDTVNKYGYLEAIKNVFGSK